MNFQDLFKYSFVISVDDNRFEWYKKVFNHYKLPVSERITSKRLHNQTPLENLGENHLKCVKLAIERKYPYALIFEDDAYPRKDIKDYLDNFLEKLNNDPIKNEIDLLYLGYYIIKEEDDKDQYIRKCVELWGAHAYIIFDKFYQKFVDEYEKDKDLRTKIDYMCQITPNSYMCSDILFEQYTPNINADYIHYRNLIPGKFKSESYNSKNKKFHFYFNSKYFEKINL